MKYKLIAIDMDGTLLNSKNQISERNLSVLHRAVAEGLYVVLSTGRILRSAIYYAKSINLNNPIIACNGAIAISEGEEDIIFEKKMGMDVSKKVIQLAEENNMYYHFYDRDTFYTKELNGKNEQYYNSIEDSLKSQGINLEILKEPEQTLEIERPDIYKFVFMEDDKDKLLDFREQLNNIEGINISSSWHNNVEIMKEGVSKGSGLEYLCKTLNIEKSQVVAIGDNENDIPMLQIAGLAVAMANGDDTIKKHSHVITDTNNEDGVAKVIEKHVLNP